MACHGTFSWRIFFGWPQIKSGSLQLEGNPRMIHIAKLFWNNRKWSQRKLCDLMGETKIPKMERKTDNRNPRIITFVVLYHPTKLNHIYEHKDSWNYWNNNLFNAVSWTNLLSQSKNECEFFLFSVHLFKFNRRDPDLRILGRERILCLCGVPGWQIVWCFGQLSVVFLLGWFLFFILLMEEILHHLGCKKPCKKWYGYLPYQLVPDFWTINSSIPGIILHSRTKDSALDGLPHAYALDSMGRFPCNNSYDFSQFSARCWVRTELY